MASSSWNKLTSFDVFFLLECSIQYMEHHGPLKVDVFEKKSWKWVRWKNERSDWNYRLLFNVYTLFYLLYVCAHCTCFCQSAIFQENQPPNQNLGLGGETQPPPSLHFASKSRCSLFASTNEAHFWHGKRNPCMSESAVSNKADFLA